MDAPVSAARLSAYLPRCVARTPSPPTTLASLPADVIVFHILRRIPLVPRVRTLSRLSKRWYELVYRSIDSVAHRSSVVPKELLMLMEMLARGRLPSLTSLSVIAMQVAPLHLPSTLRDLELCVSSVQLATPVPALTSLTLRLSASAGAGAPVGRDIIDLLCAATLLRRLHLSLDDGYISLPLLAALPTLRLPLLTDLAPADLGCDQFRLLYRQHASQLLALRPANEFARYSECTRYPIYARPQTYCSAPLEWTTSTHHYRPRMHSAPHSHDRHFRD